jgi:hypothetical protein
MPKLIYDGLANLKNKPLRERKKIRWTDLGLMKKEKQLTGRKSCSFFAKPQK